jgi:hypothetical protein
MMIDQFHARFVPAIALAGGNALTREPGAEAQPSFCCCAMAICCEITLNFRLHLVFGG